MSEKGLPESEKGPPVSDKGVSEKGLLAAKVMSFSHYFSFLLKLR